jgi:hypothetical protein
MKKLINRSGRQARLGSALQIIGLLALSCVGLNAQTTNVTTAPPLGTAAATTNSFTVTLGTNVTLSPAVPAVVVTSITVDRLMVDNVGKRATIWLHGVPQPVVISGAKFAALKATTGPTLSAALVSYLTSQAQ